MTSVLKHSGKRKRDNIDFEFAFHQPKTIKTDCIKYLTHIAMSGDTSPETIIACICNGLEQGPDLDDPLPAVSLVDSLLKARVSANNPNEVKHMGTLKAGLQKRLPQTIHIVYQRSVGPTRYSFSSLCFPVAIITVSILFS